MTQRESQFNYWRCWLLGVSGFLVFFGLALAFFGHTLLFDPLNIPVDAIFWGTDPKSPAAIKFQHFIYGVLGATMAGWGLILLFIVQNAFAKRERWAWLSIGLGVTLWYLVDTAISVYHGVSANVILNTVMLNAFMLPLTATRKYFFLKTASLR